MFIRNYRQREGIISSASTPLIYDKCGGGFLVFDRLLNYAGGLFFSVPVVG